MKYLQIGKSDIMGSVVALGTLSMSGMHYGQSDDAESVRTIHKARELGVNILDTARRYGFGKSESIIAAAIKGRRHEYILSTKGGLVWNGEEGSFIEVSGGKNVYRNLSPEIMRRQCEESLRTLGTDYLDIYFTHWQSVEPYFTPISETMGELCKLKQEGKIRAIGVSNVTPEHVREYQKYGEVDIIQQKYSLLAPSEAEVIWPLCEEYNITFEPYSFLEIGLLTGKIGMEYQVNDGDVRGRFAWYEPARRKMLLDVFDGWASYCKKYACDIVNLVIAMTLQQHPRMTVLCGSRKVSQIEDCVRGAELELDEADVVCMQRDFDNLLAEEAKMPPCESAPRRHQL